VREKKKDELKSCKRCIVFMHIESENKNMLYMILRR